ncbi:Hpt domain-containing protein [Vibrio sp. SCSIO 43133]|uniref:Hpt domain-containing protein n=1 Tax=Vibrio sp. SCSIO 43133 TaxID=2802577 RepID=UPI0020753568|nr:Hpt domain-containing protein [Vibrio sp. SCSIO 43133]USD99646.1 Hpt domain-containing protein [Vibrio sp. SCSIO 43133]
MNSYKRLFTVVAIIGMMWALAISVVVYLTSKEDQINHLMDEISISINKLQQTLFLPQPYRSKFSEQIELDIQLIHAQAIQLKSLTSSDLLSDVSHTVYLLERFVEQAELLASDETRLDEFIARVSEQTPTFSASAKALSNQLSYVVLDTLFNESIEPRQVYLRLEEIQRAAYQLPEEDRLELLALNSQASVLLSQSANTEFLIERVVNHPVMRELSQRTDQSKLIVNHQILIIVMLSIVAMALIILIAIRTMRVAQDSQLQPTTQSLATESSVEQEQHISEHELALAVEIESQAVPNQPKNALNEETEVETEQQAPAQRKKSFEAIDFSKMLNTLDGDRESMLLLLGVFVSEHAQDAERLQQHLTDDIEQATRIAHTLKGVSGSIFADELRNVATVAEKSLKESQTLSETVLSELDNNLQQAIVSAQAYIAQSTT